MENSINRVSCYHFSNVCLLKNVIISFVKFMKAYVEVTYEQRYWRTKQSERDSIGHT
jgi:hypothetical protein